APARCRVLEAECLCLAADRLRVFCNERFDVALCFALQKIRQPAWQVLQIAVHEQRVLPLELADRDSAALAYLMDDEMRAAAHRHLYAGAHLRPIGKLCEPCFEPALMAVEK